MTVKLNVSADASLKPSKSTNKLLKIPTTSCIQAASAGIIKLADYRETSDERASVAGTYR